MPAASYCDRCLTTFVGEPGACTNMACGAEKPPGGWDVVLERGDILDRHYLIDRCLAVGGAGLTYKARALGDDDMPTGPDLAIKVLYAARDSGAFLTRLSNEAQILQTIDHPNVVACHGFVTRAGHAPYLVTRFEPGGSLQEHVEKHGALPARVAADIAFQVLSGLDPAHRAGVIHRDLKPDNVLLEQPVDGHIKPRVRVADFGIAKTATVGDRLTRVGMFVGTPEYAAPEQFSGMDPSPATDVFAVGGLLVFCLTGEQPVRFTQRSDLPRTFRELIDQLPPQLPSTVEPASDRAGLQALIDSMMEQHEEDRPSVYEALLQLAPIAGRAAPPPPKGKTEPGARSSQGQRNTANERAATPAPAPRRGGGMAAFGALAALAVVALIVIAGAVGGAYALGVFDPSDTVSLPPEPVAPPEVVRTGTLDLDDTRETDLIAERDALLARLPTATGGVHMVCGATGDIPIRLTLSPTGAITEALVNPASGLDAEQRQCVAEMLEKLSLSRSASYSVQLSATLER